MLEFPGSTDGPWARCIDPATVRPAQRGRESFPAKRQQAGESLALEKTPDPLSPPGIGTVRWPRIVPKDADCAQSLRKRTLTNLYNGPPESREPPEWLKLAHKRLDEAVFAAYGWDPGIGDEELLEKLLELNLARAGES